VASVVQALMLTDIVVEATVVALLLALIVQINRRTGTVDPNAIDIMRG
jgi:multicomponent Na+:H+ antiporter subunit C